MKILSAIAAFFLVGFPLSAWADQAPVNIGDWKPDDRAVDMASSLQKGNALYLEAQANLGEKPANHLINAVFTFSLPDSHGDYYTTNYNSSKPTSRRLYPNDYFLKDCENLLKYAINTYLNANVLAKANARLKKQSSIDHFRAIVFGEVSDPDGTDNYDDYLGGYRLGDIYYEKYLVTYALDRSDGRCIGQGAHSDYIHAPGLGYTRNIIVQIPVEVINDGSFVLPKPPEAPTAHKELNRPRLLVQPAGSAKSPVGADAPPKETFKPAARPKAPSNPFDAKCTKTNKSQSCAVSDGLSTDPAKKREYEAYEKATREAERRDAEERKRIEEANLAAERERAAARAAAAAEEKRKQEAERAAFQATLARQKADAERELREYQAKMDKWRADVAACRSGDVTRCSNGQ
ncbi:hypothetical protein MB02_11710 [Croceicoccus estronivorus]|uniref:hypothetical protein n=1 Tax=Croceicoccus estronivorus TaxID=1172626 RepID=UPI000829E205|nr:hypothetical protein [Croceicoccus estronivorus]OCC23298.1 hypothetical protein MB02_11710 [Croceicoccus estronivorus]